MRASAIRVTLLHFVLIAALLRAEVALARNECSASSMPSAVAGLRSKLSGLGYPRAEASYLVSAAEKKTSELRAERLNDRGKACGIGSVRARVLDCVRATLPATLASTPAPRAKRATPADMPGWGKTEHTAGELAFIGMFHACLASAKENLFQ